MKKKPTLGCFGIGTQVVEIVHKNLIADETSSISIISTDDVEKNIDEWQQILKYWTEQMGGLMEDDE